MLLALTLTFVSPSASVALADPCYGCRMVAPVPTPATPPTTPAMTTPAPTATT
jgi:hypothetical protein